MRILNAIRYKIKKLNRKSRLFIAFAAVLILAGASISVYAKYYKTGYNKGMAIASGFYFSSNYMAVQEDIKGLTMEEIASGYRNVIISSVDNWQGTDTHFVPVEVRNYDTQLLYNDWDLDVEYQVNFMLLDEPVGANYSVKYGSTTKALTFSGGKGVVASFTGMLPGGRLADGSLPVDRYELSVSKTGSAAYVPSDILMVAYPTGPDYLVGTRCIAGILKFDYVEKPFKIEDSGFVIRKTWDSVNWKQDVAKESGFVYEVITSGNFTGSETTATRKKIQVKWDASMFKINANDKYYLSVKDDISAYYQITEGVDTYQVMEIEVLPYASIKFVFFRNDGFETKINAMTDSTKFEEAVQVKVL